MPWSLGWITTSGKRCETAQEGQPSEDVQALLRLAHGTLSTARVQAVILTRWDDALLSRLVFEPDEDFGSYTLSAARRDALVAMLCHPAP